MVNKNSRFLKKALQALPKLAKNSLIKFCENLIYEHYALLTTLDDSPVSIGMYKDSNLVYENTQHGNLTKEVPNIVLLKETGVHSIQDIKKRDRIFYITKAIKNNVSIFYIIEQTELIQSNSSQKTQDSLMALETLAAGVSHEIKNPLSSIDIHTQLLQYKIHTKKITVSTEIEKYIEIVKSESDRLLNVLDTFLNMTRKNNPVFVFTETSQILEAIYDLLSAELAQKNIFLELKMDSVPKIFTSPHILQQILLDLLRNSIEELEEIQKDKKIILSLSENNIKTHLVFSVEDSGKGIDTTTAYKIFDPYFTTKSNGTGLGLTLVKKMIDDIGGYITVGEGILGGAKFDLYFPISNEKKLLSSNK